MYFKMRPPEAYATSDFTTAFDIYQFGLTLYRMCCGNIIFDEQFARFGSTPSSFDRDRFKFAVSNGQFPDRDAFEDHIPDRLRRLIRKCLMPDPADRFRAAIDISNELAQVEDRLDWQFEKQDATRVWTKNIDSRIYRIEVDVHNTALAEKTTESGRTSRITEYCKPRITKREIQRFLGDA
jgi:serine/threonine protein kinase